MARNDNLHAAHALLHLIPADADRNEDSLAEYQEPRPKNDQPGSRSISESSMSQQQMAPLPPVRPTLVRTVNQPKKYMNHTYRDYSKVPGEYQEKPISEMTFGEKVHHMLSQEENQPYIQWLPHGRAFSIISPKKIEEKGILGRYFERGLYSGFIRQLIVHGFRQVVTGVDRPTYYHDCMLRGLPHLTKYMKGPLKVRRLLLDPENEPDFFQISTLFPLPDSDIIGQQLSQEIAPHVASPVNPVACANLSKVSPIAPSVLPSNLLPTLPRSSMPLMPTHAPSHAESQIASLLPLLQRRQAGDTARALALALAVGKLSDGELITLLLQQYAGN